MASGKKVIVTGGAGFVGSHLVESLVKKGFNITVIDNFSTAGRENLNNVKQKIKIVKVDIGNSEKLQKLLGNEKDVEFIFHLAALPRIERSNDNPEETHKSNVDGTFNILQLARLLGVKKLIFTSSSSVYGSQGKKLLNEKLIPNPQNLYAVQKLIGEKYCEMYSKVFNVKVLTLRLFNVYGGRMKGEGAYQLVFTKWLEQMEKGEPLTIFGDGKQTRDFTHVTDTIDALVKAMKYKQKDIYEIINVGSGRQVSVNYLSSLFNSKTVHVEGRKFEERFKQADNRMAKKKLLWIPKIAIEKGVAEFLSNFEKRRNVSKSYNKNYINM